MKELTSAIIQRVGDDIDSSRPLRILVRFLAHPMYMPNQRLDGCFDGYVRRCHIEGLRFRGLLIQWGMMCSQYVDDEEDKVLLATDNDLTAAVNFARTSGSKVRVHVDLHYLMLVSVKSFKICSTQQICLMLLSLLR